MAPLPERADLPSFIVIGAMKSGTSSLHHYLRQHPQICMSSVKETNFFLEAGNYGKGLDWYRSLFADHGKVCGEVSPAYSKRHRDEGVPRRLRDLLPDVSLIYILRDPIDRIVSHYLHDRILGRETRSLADAIAARSYRNNYVKTSMYHFQLTAFLEYFSLERILITTTEDLKDRRAETLRSMFQFIGVDPGFVGSDFDRLFNQTPVAGPVTGGAATGGGGRHSSLVAPPGQGAEVLERPSLDPAGRDRLAAYLAPDIDGLRAHTGRRFERWCV